MMFIRVNCGEIKIEKKGIVKLVNISPSYVNPEQIKKIDICESKEDANDSFAVITFVGEKDNLDTCIVMDEAFEALLRYRDIQVTEVVEVHDENYL